MAEYIVKSDYICDDEIHEFVENIVRCNDCKYCKPLGNFHKHLGCYNDLLNKYEVIPVCGDVFCAWGELREDA